MDFLLNSEELASLYGLPHLQQLTYLRGIRPYMDGKTGIVGIKRGISLQSIAEQLYIEPHPGIRSTNYSRAQVKRALSGLERIGLITLQSEALKLILKCNKATQNYSVQNKAVTNPLQKAITVQDQISIENTEDFEPLSKKPIRCETQKAVTPLKDNNYYIFLLQQFEKFWDNYPEQKSKEKAWQVFQTLNPNAELLMQINSALQAQIHLYQLQKSRGQWVAAWKFPANWLAQHCWKDEIQFDAYQEKKNAVHETNSRNQPATDNFWESCKSGLEEESSHDNVIEFSNWRGKSQAY